MPATRSHRRSRSATFILTWAEVTAIRSESFAEGLLALWAQHG